MGLFTGTFEAESGTISIEIDGSTTISGSGTFLIMNMGKLEFSNDLPNKDQNNPTEIQTKLGGLDLTVHNTMTNGTSLYSSLNEMTVGEQLNVTLTVNSLPTYLAIDVYGFEYNAKTEFVTLRLKPRYIFPNTTTVVTTLAGIELPVEEFYDGTPFSPGDLLAVNSGGIGSFIEAVPLHRMVDNYLEWVYGTGATRYIKSSNRVLASTPSGSILRDESLPDDNDYDVTVPTSATAGVLATISRFAAIEGSVFGNAFGVSYYIYRLYNGADATATFRPEINYSNVEGLDLDRKKAFIKYGRVQSLRGDYQNPASTSAYASADSTSEALTLDNSGNQQFTLDFRNAATYSGRYVYSTGADPDAYFNNTNIMTDACANGLRAYSKALGADGSQRISFKFRNALSLKPYQCFTLSSGTPAVFRASGASSVVYRPSRLFYDFKGDYVEGEAYAIGAI